MGAISLPLVIIPKSISKNRLTKLPGSLPLNLNFPIREYKGFFVRDMFAISPVSMLFENI